eukprot:365342-Chlamydomonas_euryale.AAC.9
MTPYKTPIPLELGPRIRRCGPPDRDVAIPLAADRTRCGSSTPPYGASKRSESSYRPKPPPAPDWPRLGARLASDPVRPHQSAALPTALFAMMLPGVSLKIVRARGLFRAD